MSLALALTMVLALLPTPAWAGEFNEKHSTVVSGFISEKGEEDIYTITVPCDGKVFVSGRARDTVYEKHNSRDYKIKIYQGDTVYFEAKTGPGVTKVDENSWLSRNYKTLTDLSLHAGTYYISVADPGWSTFQTAYPQTRYSIAWDFLCSHTNTTATEVTPATCSEAGEMQYICDDCGEVADTKKIDKLPHTPDGKWVTVTEPTCGQVGRRVQTCTVCGQETEEEAIEKLEHIYGDWELTTPPTCRDRGERTRTCTVCGEKDRESVDKSDDHDFGSWKTVREATCTSTSLRVRTCALCGEEEKDTTSKLGHSFGGWTTQKAPTCGEKGTETRKCKACGETETRSVAATGDHIFGDWKQENETRSWRKCKACGYVENRYSDPTPTATPSPTPKPSVTPTPTPTPSATPTPTPSPAPTAAPEVVLKELPFTDVGEDTWYRSPITYAYSLGLMVGVSDTEFYPEKSMTVAEAITMACRARNSYDGGTNADFQPTDIWYQTYVDYAISKGIFSAGEFDNYERAATRAEMAFLFAHALPSEGMEAINTVERLPDVTADRKYAQEIFLLYRAGVLTGQDAEGTFAPDSAITRAEAAAIITRVTLPSERKTLKLK